MCLLVLLHKVVPDYPLIVAANRDEDPARGGEPPFRWSEGFAAPRDPRAGGTWIGINPAGVLSVVTNRKGAPAPGPEVKSRGALPLEALKERTAFQAHRRAERIPTFLFSPFHWIYADTEMAFVVEHGGPSDLSVRLRPGLHVLSNVHDLNQVEAEGLIERELAHWLGTRTGADQGVIFAPPLRTLSLCYYGGLRGIGTFGRENRDGLAAAVRIAGEVSVDEIQAAMHRHGITHLIIPSWDHLLDDLASLGPGKSDLTLMRALHQWVLPSWLRPVPYQPPAIEGSGEQSVVVLEVVEEQDPATALSRHVEYFVEMEQLDLAGRAAEALGQFPADLGAAIALAQLEAARGNQARFTSLLDTLKAGIGSGYVRTLAWNRRLSLAIILARGKQSDLAREQTRLCLAEVDAARLRGLSIGQLYRLHVLARAFKLEFPDQATRDLALALLPPEVRHQLK